MTYVIGGFAGLDLLVPLVGGLTGRVKLSSCCALADPAKNLRMRAAYEDAPAQEMPVPATGAQGRSTSS